MAIKLTFHATQRMQLRSISREQVESVVRFPRTAAIDLANSKVTISIGDCAGRILTVVHSELGQDILVVTAYWQ